MSINLKYPGSASPTPAFFYDTGPRDTVGSMTKVNGVTVNAAVEIQSTEGGLLLPRMTSAQRLALPTVVDGLEVYDTTIGALFIRAGDTWVQSASAQGVQYASGTLTTAQINGMFVTPVLLIPAPGNTKSIIVKQLTLECVFAGAAFVGGGNIYATFITGATTTAPIASSLLTAGANRLSHAGGTFTSAPYADYEDTAIYLSNIAPAFTGGGTSTVNWKIWYSVIPTA